MILECGHCGAPLDVREGVSITKCRYCGKSNERQRMRTIAAQTPRNFRPPRQWVPPAQFAAPSNVTLPYHGSKAPLAIAVAGFFVLAMSAAGTYVAMRPRAGSIGGSGMSGPTLLSGVTPQVLKGVNLAQNPAGVARDLGARPSETSVYVKLGDPRFEYISISWDKGHPEHPNGFYFGSREKTGLDAQSRAALERHLTGGFEKGSWNSVGHTNFHVQPDGSMSGHVQIVVPGHDEKPNPKWKEQLATLWKVALEAAFGIPANISDRDAFELLSKGHPFSQLTAIDPTTSVDTAADAVLRALPGSVASTFIDLDISVAVDHPLFRQVDLSWKNEKGGKLRSAHFRAKPTYDAKIEALVGCLKGKLGEPKVDVTDYVNKKQSYRFPLPSGTLRVYETNPYITGHGRNGISTADWKRVVEALGGCP